MTRHHSDDYSAKHPRDTTIDQDIAAAVAAHISNGTITCPSAFSLAEDFGVAPSMIGTSIDLQAGRITKCQLGLFGYGQGPSPLDGADHVDDHVSGAITEALVDGRLSCARAWQIADDLDLSRLTVARACESLRIRINRCQLGAF